MEARRIHNVTPQHESRSKNGAACQLPETHRAEETHYNTSLARVSSERDRRAIERDAVRIPSSPSQSHVVRGVLRARTRSRVALARAKRRALRPMLGRRARGGADEQSRHTARGRPANAGPPGVSNTALSRVWPAAPPGAPPPRPKMAPSIRFAPRSRSRPAVMRPGALHPLPAFSARVPAGLRACGPSPLPAQRSGCTDCDVAFPASSACTFAASARRHYLYYTSSREHARHAHRVVQAGQ